MINLRQEILKSTGASRVISVQSVQTLWSGYGQIQRYLLEGGSHKQVIVKHIQWPDTSAHPHGWDTDISHQRKLKSYQVEKAWYLKYAQRTNSYCKVPELLHSVDGAEEMLLVMEDLDQLGYHIRKTPGTVDLDSVKACLSWLAHFHAQFLGVNYKEIWPIGTYWHLATRPDEWERMNNLPLKHAAQSIDDRLNAAKYQTLVHGDAKLANFCFHSSGEVAAVDFQYVGKGCGMKDVAYLISSCFEDQACERYEQELLAFYFLELEMVVDKYVDIQDLKKEWSSLYNYAWADFYRFLDGWSPGHWKMHDYSIRIANRVIKELTS